MSNLVATGRLDDWSEDELKNLSASDRADRAKRCFEISIRGFLALAKVLKAMDEAGDPVEELADEPWYDLIPDLLQIGYGALAPEAYFRFWRNGLLLQRVKTLPLPEQKRLAEAPEGIPVVIPDQGGGFTHRVYKPHELTAQQVQQVFAVGRVRTQKEQIAVLDQRREESARPKPTKVGPFLVDADRDGVKFAGKHGDFITADDLRAALKALRK